MLCTRQDQTHWARSSAGATQSSSLHINGAMAVDWVPTLHRLRGMGLVLDPCLAQGGRSLGVVFPLNRMGGRFGVVPGHCFAWGPGMGCPGSRSSAATWLSVVRSGLRGGVPPGLAMSSAALCSVLLFLQPRPREPGDCCESRLPAKSGKAGVWALWLGQKPEHVTLEVSTAKKQTESPSTCYWCRKNLMASKPTP